MKKEYTWNFDRDAKIWNNGEFDSIEECLAEAASGLKLDGTETVYIGEIEKLTESEIVGYYGDDLIYQMQNNVWDKVGEIAEDWLSCVKKEDISKLDEKIKKVLIDWLQEIGEMPSFYLVRNVREFDLKTGKEKEDTDNDK